ncbi:unnamed protein product [Polarella glacialis]|uniref:Uncharacterized protein n=1 Tax=Polarella glacialis TaxID=89957 RepID=A0A813JWX8_POLGL|nr:unnamed protein product [Polarella glacialis]
MDSSRCSAWSAYSSAGPTEDAHGPDAQLHDPFLFALRRRSAMLRADPKALELLNFVGSRTHEERLKNAAGISREIPAVSASSMDDAVKVLRRATADEDNEAVYEPTSGCRARLQWRDEMDRRVKRLMQDAEFALDDTLQETDKARLRCNQLDKTYDWFQKYGKKEVSKERPSPSFLCFDGEGPAMPGSLRAYSRGGCTERPNQMLLSSATLTSVHFGGKRQAPPPRPPSALLLALKPERLAAPRYSPPKPWVPLF